MKSTRKLISSLVTFCMIIQLGSAAVFADTTGFDLQAVIDAAENGATITLMGDVKQAITIPSSKEITIDLDGYSINSDSVAITNEGVLTIEDDGTVVGATDAVVNETGATMTINGGLYRSTGQKTQCATLRNKGIMSIKDSTVLSTSANATAAIASQGDLTINEGTVVRCTKGTIGSNMFDTYYSNYNFFFDGGSLTINGGEFYSETSTISPRFGNTITINGGSFQAAGSIFVFSGNAEPKDMLGNRYKERVILINDGTFTSSKQLFHLCDIYNRMTIKGGRFTSDSVFSYMSAGTLTFEGGKICSLGDNELKMGTSGSTHGTIDIYGLESFDSVGGQYVTLYGVGLYTTDTSGEKHYYYGTSASPVIREADSGTKVTVFSGNISTKAQHDIVLSVTDNSDSVVVINGKTYTAGTTDKTIHLSSAVTSDDPCISMDKYYRCSDCGKCFEDAACENEIADIDAYIASHATFSHEATLEPRVEPTYDADGHEAYYICSKCNKMFSDEECTHEIDAPVVIPRIQDEISDDMIQAIPDQEFEGTAVTPAITVKYGETTLTKDTDYSVSFANNDSIGTATVTVTGMGRYKGTATANFKIVRNASNFKISKIDDQVWTGSSIFPPVVVKDGSKTLEEGVDYIVNYSSNVNIGDATVTVTGLGFYTGTADAGFRIVRRPITLANIDTISSKTYKGEAIRPSITVRDGNKVLTPVDDYTVDYDDNIDAGTATVTVTGVGNYCEELETTFTITGRSIIGASIESIPDQTFTGSAIKPAVTVKLNGATLTKDTDYTVTYSDNVNAGQATVTIKGIGNNSGEKSTTFDIMPKSKNELTIRKVSDQEYTGEAITPNVTIYDGDTKLIKNEDYTLTYDDSNVKVGSSEIMIKFKGNYSGTAFTTFNIVPVTLSKTNISAIDDQVCTGKKLYPEVTVKDGTKVLTEGKDYDIEYSDNTDVGTATVTVQGKGNYEGKAVKTFEIVATVITKDDITPIEDQLYTGSAITPAVTVKIGSTKLVEGTDYDVAYEDNVEIGAAKAIVTGKGKYAGEITIQFAIVKPGVTYEWKQSGGEWYYVDSDGNFTKGLAVIDGSTYYFDDSGKMLTGWQTIDGVKHYFNTKNGVMATGITKISSKLYWLDDEGAIKTGWYTDDAGKKYYFTSSGAVKDAKKISGKYYLFDKNFVMLKSGWKKDSKGNTYKLDSKGVATVKKWAKKSGKWYYFGSNGKMVKGKSLKIGKKTYKFKSNGVCTNK